jgi:ribosomal protein L15
MRIPKLRGFRNPLKVEYEVVNIGAIAALAESGAFEPGEPAGAKSKGKPAPITINQEILRATGLVRTLDKPMKILGGGELATPLFVVADAFSRTAVAKIEAAGGSVNVLEIPTRPMPALTGAPAGAPPAAPVEAAPAEPETPAAPARRRRAAKVAPANEAAAAPAATAEAPATQESAAESEAAASEGPAAGATPADDEAAG